MSEESIIKRGVVKWWDDTKGYGFIVAEQGADVFVHYTGIRGVGRRSLLMGDEVEYIEGTNNRGVCAEDVVVTKTTKIG